MKLVVEAGVLAEPGGRLREGIALLVEDGAIAAIDRLGAFSDVAAERLGDQNCLALPGFVNAHQHGRPDSTVTLGVQDAPLECWLVALLAAPGSDPYGDTLRLCGKLATAGVTTAVHSHYTTAATAEEYEHELKAILAGYRDGGIRGVVAADLRDRGQPVFGREEDFLAELPSGLRAKTIELMGAALPLEPLLEVVEGLRADVRSSQLGDVDVIYGPPGPPWCSDALFARVAEA